MQYIRSAQTSPLYTPTNPQRNGTNSTAHVRATTPAEDDAPHRYLRGQLLRVRWLLREDDIQRRVHVFPSERHLPRHHRVQDNPGAPDVHPAGVVPALSRWPVGVGVGGRMRNAHVCLCRRKIVSFRFQQMYVRIDISLLCLRVHSAFVGPWGWIYQIHPYISEHSGT